MASRNRETANSESNNWSNQLRKVLLAGVGAVVLAQEEIEDFVEKLVKKGEMAEKDGKKLLADILSRRKKEVTREVASLETDLHSRIENVLHRVKLVSKKDVDQLAAKIDALATVVDKLSKGQRAN